ncbi:MAG: hypothetical protein NVSMB18_06650 [Acetobacteraceae bacterium]
MGVDPVIHHGRGHPRHVHPRPHIDGPEVDWPEIDWRRGDRSLRLGRSQGAAENGGGTGGDREERAPHATMTVRNMPISMW